MPFPVLVGPLVSDRLIVDVGINMSQILQIGLFMVPGTLKIVQICYMHVANGDCVYIGSQMLRFYSPSPLCGSFDVFCC